MNPAIESSLCVLAWLVTLIRLPSIIRNKAWQSDRIAFHVWMATFFFAMTMTFLVTPISDAVNQYTLPNFSRWLAYSSVSMTLYLTASSFMVTFPTRENQRQLRYLKPYLVITLFVLAFLYFIFVARTPEWKELPIPMTVAEMAFKSVIFSYATLLCIIMATACYRYLHQEAVTVTKFRMITIILTASNGAAFFFTKLLLTLGYIWSPLGADWIHALSKLLMIVTAMLWGSAFLHNNVYARFLAMLRGIRYWPAYQDLASVVESLERLFPPVGMKSNRAEFWQFVRNADFHLYRAIVHILDGKAMLKDYVRDSWAVNPSKLKWDEDTFQEALYLDRVLKDASPADGFADMISIYRLAGKQLMQVSTLTPARNSGSHAA